MGLDNTFLIWSDWCNYLIYLLWYLHSTFLNRLKAVYIDRLKRNPFFNKISVNIIPWVIASKPTFLQMFPVMVQLSSWLPTLALSKPLATWQAATNILQTGFSKMQSIFVTWLLHTPPHRYTRRLLIQATDLAYTNHQTTTFVSYDHMFFLMYVCLIAVWLGLEEVHHAFFFRWYGCKTFAWTPPYPFVYCRLVSETILCTPLPVLHHPDVTKES